ncbi:MAG: CPBP family glutamic-type intramembrane protease, partial [Verrucomicrobiota bacterium]
MQRQRPFILFGLNESAFNWKGVFALALIFFGAVLFAALVSPLVYFGVVAWAEASPDTVPGWLSSRMAAEDFPRYFDRVRWVPVVLLLPWLFRWTGLLSLRRLGFARPLAQLRPALAWLAAGVGMLGAVAAVQLLTTQVSLSEQLNASYLLEKIALGLLTGLVVALLEELLFRGLILRLFYTAMKPWPAIILSAAFFAYVHFKGVPWPQEQAVTW